MIASSMRNLRLRTICILAMVTAAVGVVQAGPGSFDGTAQIEQDLADPSGRTWTVLRDLRFTDPDGTVWITLKGDKTDGASIPQALWTLVGSPFTGTYVRAALIHDHYCQKEHRVRTWQQTHLMFYNAMIAGGVGRIKADEMYYGVYCCGPKWMTLEAGVPCGDACIAASPQVPQHNYLPKQDTEATKKDIDETNKLIEERAAAGNPLSLDELRARADAHGANPFDAKGNLTR
jgi:hypothetical protein